MEPEPLHYVDRQINPDDRMGTVASPLQAGNEDVCGVDAVRNQHNTDTFWAHLYKAFCFGKNVAQDI